MHAGNPPADTMRNILAIDTSTEACSVALRLGEVIRHRWELIPRQHSQRLFSMLEEVVAKGSLQDQGIEVLAYAQGPGSFTGLRIAASAVQGLAFASGLPAVGVSTLACLAQRAWREQLAAPADRVLVLLDARINEVYWGWYELREGIATALVEDSVAAPADLPAELEAGSGYLFAVGSGLKYLAELPASLQAQIQDSRIELWPDSYDVLHLAQAEFAAGRSLVPAQVQPVYLRNEISWKKLAEQGK